MKQNKILHLTYVMNKYGGIQNYLMNIYRKLDKEKWQFDFLVHKNAVGDFDDEIRSYGGKVLNIIDDNDNIISYLIKTIKFFRRNKNHYELIHIHVTSGIRVIDAIIAKFYGYKIILHSHCNLREANFKYFLTKILYKLLGNYFTGCSAEAAQYFFGKNIVKKHNYSISYNAINYEIFDYNIPNRIKMRKLLSLENLKVMIYVGRFSQEKGIDFIVDILKYLVSIDESYHLLLIGGTANDLYFNIDSNIQKHITFLGTVSNVYDYLQAADVYVGPSKNEGLGISFIEAQAAGLLVFASDRVPIETKVTSKIVYCSLDIGFIEWGKIINDNINYKRVSEINSFKKSEYDLTLNVLSLTKIYNKLLDNDDH
ncbi:MAG: glycosyltransferase [Acholeplasma sp.]|nr:glycosyltransferase [Acholeplasma sp.]